MPEWWPAGPVAQALLTLGALLCLAASVLARRR